MSALTTLSMPGQVVSLDRVVCPSSAQAGSPADLTPDLAGRTFSTTTSRSGWSGWTG